ncbi:MAG: ABC transporter permease [Gammaproteobacteria bacterium]|nr:ABC transporter permease [Gammaproteobacteria bacterium]
MIWLRGIIITVGLLVFWQVFVWVFQLPTFILPTPLEVFHAFYANAGILAAETWPTLLEMLLGLLAGVTLGCSAALAIALFKPLRLWVLPILVMSQAIPTFAIAPLLVMWLGYGMASKVAMVAIVVFFPITTSFYDGLKRTAPIWLDLAKTMGGTPWRVLWRIRVPAALPQLGSGLRIAAAIAPIGAIIGEWVGSSYGLGFLMLNANGRLQIALMFATLVIITILALILYFGVDMLLKKFITW